MDCNHKNFSKEDAELDFLGMKFNHNTLVCNDCGAYLRGKDFESAYMEWLNERYHQKRDKFQVQCHLSKNLTMCLDKFIEDYPGVTQAALMRALVTVYINHIDINTDLVSRFNSLMNKDILSSFNSDDDRKKVNIQFKPKMMVQLISISELVLQRPSQICETSIIKMMACFTSQDENLKTFWNQEIQGYIDTILKAA
ncbi:MAG: hypothetical protein HOE90_24610 [Bacteriovoracaceae bacterium]|jgi:hypothetical protein|nr:hypothetical protein [Bacteriovoracaceae bacterium]